ncbi:MAG: TetR family transcriptional regulator, partial [Henriciella sp.]|uniref:TetR family transcriptional regulator n=1 Tax=Henriciella sp. TaxID=1968823 RepID=UPI003C74A431
MRAPAEAMGGRADSSGPVCLDNLPGSYYCTDIMGEAADRLGARERLLRAAISLIGEYGPERMTHRLVAKSAGLSPGTATYHFSSLRD